MGGVCRGSEVDGGVGVGVGVVLVSAPRDCQVVGPGLRACVEGCLAARVRWVGALAWGAGGVLGGCV
jgi:hypothetical protein